MHVGDNRKECCKPESGNLDVIHKRPDLDVYVCKICGCRHFELTADPIKVQARMSGVGG